MFICVCVCVCVCVCACVGGTQPQQETLQQQEMADPCGRTAAARPGKLVCRPVCRGGGGGGHFCLRGHKIGLSCNSITIKVCKEICIPTAAQAQSVAGSDLPTKAAVPSPRPTRGRLQARCPGDETDPSLITEASRERSRPARSPLGGFAQTFPNNQIY